VALLDTETTGLDPLVNRVIEVAVAVADPDGTIVRSCSWFVDPGCEITEEITEITGITDKDVLGAPTFGAIAHGIADFMGNDAIPAAYNAAFDRRFISAEWARLGREAPPFLRHNIDWLDPYIWVRFLDKYAKGKGRYKLGAAAERMGIVVETAHRALADVETALKVYQLMKPRLLPKFQKSPTVDRFMMLQKILAAKQEDEFLTFVAGLPDMEVTEIDELLTD
jgi:DNA polymerase III epsilon subunit family exonuclease